MSIVQELSSWYSQNYDYSERLTESCARLYWHFKNNVAVRTERKDKKKENTVCIILWQTRQNCCHRGKRWSSEILYCCYCRLDVVVSMSSRNSNYFEFYFDCLPVIEARSSLLWSWTYWIHTSRFNAASFFLAGSSQWSDHAWPHLGWDGANERCFIIPSQQLMLSSSREPFIQPFCTIN